MVDHSGILNPKELVSIQSQCLVILAALGVSFSPLPLTRKWLQVPVGNAEGRLKHLFVMVMQGLPSREADLFQT